MRVTLLLDDDLVRIAQEFTGVVNKTTLVREALKSLIEQGKLPRVGGAGRYTAGIEKYSTQTD